VLLLGAQRSGTTALAHALSNAFAAQGGIFTVNGRLPYVLRRWLTSADLAGRHLRADDVLHALARRPAAGRGANEWQQATEQVLRRAATEVAEGQAPLSKVTLAGQIVTASYAAWPFWGDKYNEYLLDLPWLLRLLPNARFLVVVRDPADVAASMLSWSGDRPYNPTSRAAALVKWKRWNDAWLTFADRVPAPVRLVVEYRDLCEGGSVNRLEEFLSLPLREHLTSLRSRRRVVRPSVPVDVHRTWCAMRDSAGMRD
jgi:hypothetical protein